VFIAARGSLSEGVNFGRENCRYLVMVGLPYEARSKFDDGKDKYF